MGNRQHSEMTTAIGNRVAGRKQLVRGGDPHATVRQALIKLDPSRFGRISKDTFVVQSQGRLGLGSMFSDPSFEGSGMLSLLNGRVYVDNEVIGDIVPKTLLTQLSRFYHKINDKYEFACSSIFNKTTGTHEIIVEGQGTGADRTRMTLFNLVKPKGTFHLEGMSKNVSPTDASFLFKEVMQRGVQNFEEHVGGGAAAAVFLNVTINNTVVCVGDPLADPDKLSDLELLRDTMWEAAAKDGLRKLDGDVYEQIAGAPCAYVKVHTYRSFIVRLFADNRVYQRDPRRYDDLIKTLTNSETQHMPWLEVDRDIISFSNGVVQLATNVFTPYLGMDMESPLACSAARHHIPLDYTGSTDTPLFDLILLAQFGPDVAEVLCALVGRCLFKVKERDNWQVMPFMVGLGGTGKSIIMNVAQRMFAEGAVGNLAARREEVFGMANLIDAEVVFGRDMPAKLSLALAQETLQSMVTGEPMEIPRKGIKAMHTQWTAPMIIASNHLPDYNNTGNNVGRRIVTFRFDNVIDKPQEDLEDRILENELPNIVARCLLAYANMQRAAKRAGSFWEAVPDIMKEWKGILAQSTNHLAAFLALDDDTRKCSITCVPGHITWVEDFKAAYEVIMGPKSYVSDPAVLHANGFSLPDKHVNVCRSCKQRLVSGCCSNYARVSNQTKKPVIMGMMLQLPTLPGGYPAQE